MTYSARLRVFVVSEDSLLRWAVQEVLSAAGHIVVDGGAARYPAEDAAPDVVVIGPEGGAAAQANELRTFSARVPSSALVAIPIDDTRETRFAALRAGATRLTPHPFDVHQLPQLVADANRCRPI